MKKSWSIAVAALLVGSVALACNVPVFRYALERWIPDSYEIVLFHEGPLTSVDEKLVKQLTDAEDQGRANIRVTLVDLDKQPAEVRQELLRTQPDARFPWLIVRYPEMMGNPAIVWSGRLEAEALTLLLHSPARREIAKRLTAGDSVVWVMLESGDAKQDDAAAQLVEARLKKLPETLKLPELTDSADDRIEGKTPLKLAFSLLRISRTNPADRFLVRLLSECEEDLAIRNDPFANSSTVAFFGTPAPLQGLVGAAGQTIRVEPMVFPVFGRGRSLFPWVGKGITADNIEKDCRELIAPCSCTVKRMNPGFDLLIAAEWEQLIGGQFTKEEPKEPSLVSLSNLGQAKQAEPPAGIDTKPTAPAGKSVASGRVESSQPGLWRNLLWAGLGGLAILLVATMFILGKHKPNQS